MGFTKKIRLMYTTKKRLEIKNLVIIFIASVISLSCFANNYVAFTDNDGDFKYIKMQTGAKTNSYEDDVTQVSASGNYVAFMDDYGDFKYINMNTGTKTDSREDNVTVFKH